jgi:predicted SAM-dependent methyltransferase
MSVETTSPGQEVGGGLRLNIGCGESRRRGYIGVDARPDKGTDHVSPAWDLSAWPDGSIAEIYCRHTLEHLDPCDAHRTLVAWRAALAPGGLAHIIVPDLIFHARQLLGEVTSWDSDPERNFEHAIKSLYGWRASYRGGDDEDAHRWGYTESSLCELLAEVGFVSITRVTDGEDSEPWHLNLKAWNPR